MSAVYDSKLCKVIAISGLAQSGKDTTGAIMKEELEKLGHSVLITHYADLLKYICKTFFGWDGNKDYEGRTLLQYIGTDVVRKYNPDFWVGFIVDILRMFPDKWDYVIIPDCRFPNEKDVMSANGFETKLVRIIRPGHDSGMSEGQLKHSSETAMDGVGYDYVINNHGDITELKGEVLKFLEVCLNEVQGN